MSHVAERITPYLPPLLQRWLMEEPDTRWREATGSVVLLDVSGFTRLSERLARLGRVGAEILSDTISERFADLLVVTYEEGGTLLKFGGDALSLLFVDDEHERRACRAAARMQQTLRRLGRVVTPAGTVRLRMSVGVHSGTFDLFLVGSSHRELLLAGPAFSEVVRLERAAAPGEVLMSPKTAAALGDPRLERGHPSGVLLRRPPSGTSALAPPTAVVAGEAAVVGLPVALRTHVLSGRTDSEHRRVTAAFVHFGGTDRHLAAHGWRATADVFERLVSDVQDAVDRHDLAFLGSDVDHDGGKLLLAAGAPVSHGDEEERMLLALRQLMAAERPLPVRVGVNQGHVYAGDVGPSFRRTYTLMGDAVNLAARLMDAAAPGEILTTGEVTRASRTLFATTALPPMQAKGKRRPVHAHRLGPPVRGRTSTPEAVPLVGRQAELGRLRSWVAAAAGGGGRLIEVVAEPGMGKSRVLEDLRRHPPLPRAVAVVCERHETTTSYAAARQLLLGALAAAGRDSEDPLTAVERVAEQLPAVRPWLPLLGPVLGVDVPPTAATALLGREHLRQRLHRTAAEVLDALLEAPTLLTFEDVHWMDEASVELLRFLSYGVAERPLAVCVTRRAGGGGFTAPDDGPPVEHLILPPLPAAAAEQLVLAATERAPLPGHVVADIVERGGGNPMYLIELVAGATRTGGVEQLPDSLETLLAARIDQLPPEDRASLRRLAVLGSSFDRTLAAELLGGDADAALERLDAFLEVGGESVAFRHGLVWESAYEALPYRLRQRLHDDVVDVLEHIAAGDPDGQVEALSFQCLQAHRFDAAWRYSLRAAERAARIYANSAAAVFYERAIAAAGAIEDLPACELARVHESLGDVRERMGTFAEAGAAYLAARRLCAGEPVDEARLLLKYAWQQGRLRRYSQARRWVSTGLRLVEGRRDQAAQAQRSQLLVAYARFLQLQGRHRQAITWCKRGIPVAQAAGERRALAHAYKILDHSHVFLGENELAVNAPRALELYEEVGDVDGQAAVLNMMGAFAYWGGRWSEARELYGRAMDIWVPTGQEDGIAFAKANMGEILSDQGRLEEAEELLRDALRIWVTTGHRAHAAMARSDLGRVASRAGRHAEAARLFAEARAELEVAEVRDDVVETDMRSAESLVLQGRAAEALAVVERHLAGRGDEDGDGGASHPALRRVQGYALIQRGDLPGARRALEASLAAARRRDATYEVALTLRALASLAERDGGDDPAPLRAASEEILDGLDVVALPRVPLPPGPPASPQARAAIPAG